MTIKRALLWGASLFGASVLAGCPIYPDEPYACTTNSECPTAYSCNPSNGICYPTNPGGGGYGGNGTHCNKPSDCGPNETCTSKNECRVGDCTFPQHGCVSGFSCKVSDGSWKCIATNSSGGSGNDAASGGGGAAGSSGSAGSTSSGGVGGISPGDGATGGVAGSTSSGGSAGSTSTGGSAGSTGSGGSAGSTGGGGASGTDGGSDASSDGA